MTDVSNVLQWEGLAAALVSLGVKSFSVLKAAMQDAGVDEATIASLEPKWDALASDVKRAAGGDVSQVPAAPAEPDGPVG